MEKIFRGTVQNMTSYNGINLRKLLIEKFESILYVLPPCHNLKTKIIRRFVIFRLKIYSTKHKPVPKNLTFASKTMAMHMRIR